MGGIKSLKNRGKIVKAISEALTEMNLINHDSMIKFYLYTLENEHRLIASYNKEIRPLHFGINFVETATNEQLKEIIKFSIIGLSCGYWSAGTGWMMYNG